jgi:hypothetical protein
MSIPVDAQPGLPAPPRAPGVAPPPGPPAADMMAGPEMQAYLRRLQADERRIGGRNRWLGAALAAAVVLLAAALWGVYRATIGAYAVLDDLRVEQHPINPGRIEIAFRVVSPGKVHCRRASGAMETDLIDYFHAPCEVERPWSWAYEPGKDVRVSLWYRRGLWRRELSRSFPTPTRADIVVLIDTTGSMSPSIAELKEKCVTYAEQLQRQAIEPRFALVGFGDVAEGDWLDLYGFTSDILEFQLWTESLKRFDGGDLPESALDALEEALALPLDPGALRRFYLVTDAAYHEPSRSGATAEMIAERLAAERVSLQVFSRPAFADDYGKLLGDAGRFLEIENFGRVLAEGRLIED